MADEALAQALADGAAHLGVALDAPQQAMLLDYQRLIGRWTRTYNLTAVREPAQMLVQHLLDSLALVGPLRRHSGGAPRALLDVGSGAGLPGVVLAIACPELEVTCVDTVAKKAGFMRQAGAELGLRNLTAVHARVEALKARPWDLIVSRAFASLADFVGLTGPLLAADGVWIAMKGRRPDDEIVALPPGVEAFHVEPLQVPGLEAERCLVWLRPRREA